MSTKTAQGHFAIFEVTGRDVYRAFMDALPDHNFILSEGKQSQEIFVGVHKRLQMFGTQRLEFKGKRDYIRPGMLVSVRLDGQDYSLLFLHLKSGEDPDDFGIRDQAIMQAFSLKRALDRTLGSPANFIVAGDLNTMGLDDPAPYSRVLDMSGDVEIERIADMAPRRDMVLLEKSSGTTWWNGRENTDPADLDHVISSEHMDIRGLDGAPQVTSLGWPLLDGADRDAWLSDYSDHAMLWFELWTAP